MTPEKAIETLLRRAEKAKPLMVGDRVPLLFLAACRLALQTMKAGGLCQHFDVETYGQKEYQMWGEIASVRLLWPETEEAKEDEEPAGDGYTETDKPEEDDGPKEYEDEYYLCYPEGVVWWVMLQHAPVNDPTSYAEAFDYFVQFLIKYAEEKPKNMFGEEEAA